MPVWPVIDVDNPIATYAELRGAGMLPFRQPLGLIIPVAVLTPFIHQLEALAEVDATVLGVAIVAMTAVTAGWVLAIGSHGLPGGRTGERPAAGTATAGRSGHGRRRASTGDPDRVREAAPVSTNRVLDGRYELGDVIGHGGMASVHTGRDMWTGRQVAIKVLRQDLAQDPVFRSRFRREAQTMASLTDPTIVAIFDTGYDEVGDGSAGTVRVPFIVMEQVDGCSLRELVRAGGLSLEESIQYQVGVLAALEFSHRAGVVHCDIKPANVMVTPEGAVKLVDFGIARAGGDAAATMTAHTESFLGTPAYLSPEQARGERADVWSDLYSAGCLFYELVTGRPPFVGDPISVAYRHVHEEPAPAGTAVAALDSVLQKALAKLPTDRFQSAQAFSEALLSAARGITHDLSEAPAAGGRTGMSAVVG